MSRQIDKRRRVGLIGILLLSLFPIGVFAATELPKGTESFISKDKESDPTEFDRSSTNTPMVEPTTTPPAPTSRANEAPTTSSVESNSDAESDAAPDTTSNAQLPAAVVWYKDLAEKGDKEAQYNLGAVYETGFGVKVDFKESSKWYQMAAEQEHVLAQLHLGVLYLLGKGVKESSIKGAKWIRASANNGNELAKMINEKVLSSSGDFKLDEKKVIAEVHAALENGDIYAQEKLIHILAKLKKKEQNQPKKERFAGNVTGSGAKPGTVQNEVPAFLNEKSGQQALPESDLISIRRHANEGEAEAQYMLGRMYETGRKVEKDKTHAVTWYKSAASQGHRDAQYRLALSLIYGLGTEKNINQGGEWLHKAAAQKHEAANRLISYFTSPESGAVNYNCSLAFAWNLERALNGDGDAQLSIGYMLENGWGVYQNVAEAREWLVKSRAAGAKGAAGQLRQMKVSEIEGELPTRAPVRHEAPIESTSPPSGETNTPVVTQQRSNAQPSNARSTTTPVTGQTKEKPKEKGFFDFDFSFSLPSIPSSMNIKSLMVPVGLILIGLVLGMVVFRWMDRMMSGGQQPPQQHREESLF